MASEVRAPLGQLRMAEQVASALRERILSAEILSGTLLPKQDELVAEFGVSYPSVREGLRILETEGLITVRRGNVGGAVVHAPDQNTAGYTLGLALQAMRVKVPDLGDALAVLEPMCAVRCAQRADRAEMVVPALQKFVELGEEHLDDEVEFTRISREFHGALVALNDNATLRLVVGSLSSLWSVQEEAWASAASASGKYPSKAQRRESLHAHSRLTEEIAKGRVSEVERIARQHVTVTQARVGRTLKRSVVDAASPTAKARFRG